jgi:hypothetical protein
MPIFAHGLTAELVQNWDSALLEPRPRALAAKPAFGVLLAEKVLTVETHPTVATVLVVNVTEHLRFDVRAPRLAVATNPVVGLELAKDSIHSLPAGGVDEVPLYICHLEGFAPQRQFDCSARDRCRPMFQ